MTTLRGWVGVRARRLLSLLDREGIYASDEEAVELVRTRVRELMADHDVGEQTARTYFDRDDHLAGIVAEVLLDHAEECPGTSPLDHPRRIPLPVFQVVRVNHAIVRAAGARNRIDDHPDAGIMLDLAAKICEVYMDQHGTLRDGAQPVFQQPLLARVNRHLRGTADYLLGNGDTVGFPIDAAEIFGLVRDLRSVAVTLRGLLDAYGVPVTPPAGS